jgi:hypothetical protein
VVSIMEALATQVNSPNGMSFQAKNNWRLDVAKQVRGDLKETYNMGKFADADYKHNEPDTITKRREELLAFQIECYQVEQKVLVLFALALEVYRSISISDTNSYLMIISPSSIPQRKISSGLRNIPLQIFLLSTPIWVQGHTAISEVSLFCTSSSTEAIILTTDFKMMSVVSKSSVKGDGLTQHPFQILFCWHLRSYKC